jgi:hypothetical protein
MKTNSGKRERERERERETFEIDTCHEVKYISKNRRSYPIVVL